MMKSMVAVVGAMGLMAACGGDDGQPPLAITPANATAVAGEVLVGATSVSSFGGGLSGGLGASKTVVELTKPQLVTTATQLRRLPSRPAAAPITQNCGVSGTETITQDGATSAKIVYSACVEDAGTTLDGSMSATYTMSGTGISISASLDLTITHGAIVVTESGDMKMSFASSDDDASFDLSSSHLSASITNGGTLVSDITLSNLTMHFGTTTSGGQSVSTVHEKFDVDSSTLKGSFTVETSADVQTDDSSAYAASGSLTITGASGSSLKITIEGDDTYMPATGEGQIKLEVSGQVIWTNWADLEAASGTH